MKIINAIIIMLALSLISCQKPESDGEDDKSGSTVSKKDETGGAGGDNGGWADDGNAVSGDTLNVATFSSGTYSEAVWVKGYIVGCATSTGGYTYTFDPPFDAATAVLLADSKYEKDKSRTIAIQLWSGSEIRSALNLVDNPGNLHRLVAVYGYQTTYLKLRGMKKILDYKLR